MKLLSKIILEKESQNKEGKERNNSLNSEESRLITKSKKEKELTSSPEKDKKVHKKAVLKIKIL